MQEVRVSLDSAYDFAVDKYLDKYNMVYEKYNDGYRTYYTLLKLEKNNKKCINNALTELIVQDIKLKSIIRSAGIGYIDDATRLLLAEMLFFDNRYEERIINDIINEYDDISINGIVNFRIGDIKENWDYLARLYRKVCDSYDDMLVLAQYMHENIAEDINKLYLMEDAGVSHIYNLAEGKFVEEKCITANLRDNNLYTIISEHSNDLYLHKDRALFVDTTLISKVMNVHIIQ